MWEAISAWGGWSEIGAAGAWLVTLCLLTIGLAGCFLPVLPGPLIILIQALFHWFLFREASGVEWWTFAVLIALLAASQIFDLVSGAAGSKWFGGTKWGVAGALVGAIVGLFFMPLGLILGPVIGAYSFELLFAKQGRSLSQNGSSTAQVRPCRTLAKAKSAIPVSASLPQT